MNNDLISRKYMKEAIEQFFVREKYYHPYSKGRKTIPTEEVLDIIDNAPTVTPTFGLFKDMLCSDCEKRPQGEWIEDYTEKKHKKVVACDKCHCLSIQGKTNFCSNCGADMRKGGAE